MSNINCPVCSKEGKTSECSLTGTISQFISFSDFNDEKGRKHRHDNALRRNTYMCSIGHIFDHIIANSCWCGWKGPDDSFEVLKQ